MKTVEFIYKATHTKDTDISTVRIHVTVGYYTTRKGAEEALDELAKAFGNKTTYNISKYPLDQAMLDATPYSKDTVYIPKSFKQDSNKKYRKPRTKETDKFSLVCGNCNTKYGNYKRAIKQSDFNCSNCNQNCWAYSYITSS